MENKMSKVGYETNRSAQFRGL